MKRLAEDSHLFRVEQVPPRLHDKERIILSFREMERYLRDSDKISSEAKRSDSKLDDIEAWIHDEAKRVDHLHPKDAKNNCDQIERELLRTEDVIKSMFNDVQVLRDNRYYQANELHR
ncbi:Plectin, partial [Caligus rogercresseyi]